MASSIFGAKRRISKPLSALAVHTRRHREIKHTRDQKYLARSACLYLKPTSRVGQQAGRTYLSRPPTLGTAAAGPVTPARRVGRARRTPRDFFPGEKRWSVDAMALSDNLGTGPGCPASYEGTFVPAKLSLLSYHIINVKIYSVFRILGHFDSSLARI